MSSTHVLAWAWAAVAFATGGRAAEYDPLAAGTAPTHLDLVVRDEGRPGRAGFSKSAIAGK
jgi:hypothetical protein